MTSRMKISLGLCVVFLAAVTLGFCGAVASMRAYVSASFGTVLLSAAVRSVDQHHAELTVDWVRIEASEYPVSGEEIIITASKGHWLDVEMRSTTPEVMVLQRTIGPLADYFNQALRYVVSPVTYAEVTPNTDGSVVIKLRSIEPIDEPVDFTVFYLIGKMYPPSGRPRPFLSCVWSWLARGSVVDVSLGPISAAKATLQP